MSNSIEEITARLEAATRITPAPWTVFDERPLNNGGGIYLMYLGERSTFMPDGEHIMFTFEDDWLEEGQMETNLEFIAHAPADIAFLLGRIRDLEAAATEEGTTIREVQAWHKNPEPYTHDEYGMEHDEYPWISLTDPNEAHMDILHEHSRLIEERTATPWLPISPRVTGTGKDS